MCVSQIIHDQFEALTVSFLKVLMVKTICTEITTEKSVLCTKINREKLKI